MTLNTHEGYPVAMLCDLLDLPRSSYYYQRVESAEPELEEAIKEIAGKFPTYGSRRITHQLRRMPYGMRVNRKKVQRMMRHLGLIQPRKSRKRRTTDSDHPFKRYPNRVKGLEVDHPDQVWVADITYVRLGEGFVYLAVVMDVYTRAIRGWNLARSLDQELTLKALRSALWIGVPEIHHSDQGVHYAAIAYVELLMSHDVQISMAAVGRADENGYAERLIRTIKEEEVNLSEYRNFHEARSEIGYFIEDVYQSKRIHSALGYLTPVEFQVAWELAPEGERVPLILA
jgi:transposase InsO family protein